LWFNEFSFCMKLKILSLGFFLFIALEQNQRHFIVSRVFTIKFTKTLETMLVHWKPIEVVSFLKRSFKEVLLNHRICHELIVPYTLEQNGCVEWKNCIIMECVHNMLNSIGVDIKFWVETTHTYVYILNCASLKTLNNKTPFEAQLEVWPSVEDFKTFRLQRIFTCPKSL
jgi:hypothetical protein